MVADHDPFITLLHQDVGPASLLTFFFFLLVLGYFRVGVMHDCNITVNFDSQWFNIIQQGFGFRVIKPDEFCTGGSVVGKVCAVNPSAEVTMKIA